MNSDKRRQAKQLYEAALKCLPEESPLFLDESCDGDGELRREAESLLSFSDKNRQSQSEKAFGY